MRFVPENPTKRSSRSLKMILERLYCMHQNLICRLQPFGYHRYVEGPSHLNLHFFFLFLNLTVILVHWVFEQVLFAGAAAGVWAYQRHKSKNNVHIMALNLVRSVPLTPNEKQTMLDLLKPPPRPRTTFSIWRRWQSQWRTFFLALTFFFFFWIIVMFETVPRLIHGIHESAPFTWIR